MLLSVVAVGDAQCHGQGCRLAGVAGWVTVQSAGPMLSVYLLLFFFVASPLVARLH